MQRREFISLLGGAAVVGWPLAARTQQPAMPVVGVLNAIAANDKEAQPRAAAFEQRLRELGRIKGSNIKIEHRWVAGGPEAMRSVAKELVDLKPDVLVAHASTATDALRAATTSIPIIFVNVTDPIGPGFVASLARPGGNITGFTNFEATMSGKWFGLLKEISPDLSQAYIVYNPKTAPYIRIYLPQFETAAALFAIKLIVMPFLEPAEIESAIEKSASGPKTGLLVLPDISTLVHRDAIIRAAARYRLPAVYPYRFFVDNGGLISYGVDNVDQYRRVASYVDLILKGAKPSELPVQQPVNFELVINLKTAKALGLTVPPALLTTADHVIE
jgi:putative ABC transport system substrate-binding protein